MSRKMYITDDMGLDEMLVAIADTDITTALMWPWFVPVFDDWGRAEASARRLRGKVFPNFEAITVETVEKALLSFASKELISLYVVDGIRYMAIEHEKWFTYQSHIHKEKRINDGSKYPPPPSNNVNWNTSRGKSRDCAENRASLPPSVTVTVTPSVTPSFYGAAQDAAPPNDASNEADAGNEALSTSAQESGDGIPLNGSAGRRKAKQDNEAPVASSNRFVPPTIEQAEEYFEHYRKEKNLGAWPPLRQGYRSHGEDFVDHHTNRKWTLSNGRKASDWKACARTWIGNMPRFAPHGKPSSATKSGGYNEGYLEKRDARFARIEAEKNAKRN